MSNEKSLPQGSQHSSRSKGLVALLPFFKPYRSDVFLALLALLVTALMVLFFGKAIKYLIDFGFVEKDRAFLDLVLFIFITATLVMAVAGYYRSSLINKTAEKVIADLRKKAYDHVVRLSAEFFESTKAGDIISRLTSDTVILYTILSNTISFFLRNSLLFLGGIVALFMTSSKMTFLSIVLILIATAPIIFMSRKVKLLAQRSQASLASVGSHLEETISAVKTIQSYLCEEKEIRNFNSFVDETLAISLAKIRLRSKMIALVISLAFGGIAIVLWIGGKDVLNGQITAGDLSSFIFYSIITATSLVSFSQIAGQIQSASSAAKRIFELLSIESQVEENKDAQPFPDLQEITIKFQDVDFSYPSRPELLVLKNFNLEIKPHQKVALVGSSGSGKSTILQLLLRFYDVNSGMISLNERDIKSLSFFDLRKNFSYISQDCFIFSGTVFENIAYIDQSITEAEVERVIEQNPALHFINNLPQKIHSLVGEKGIKLSGGEKQRISIARAIIKDSPVLLLDEATSALDIQNEQIVNHAIAELARDKTVITITHKFSSLNNCDYIVFIKDGEIVEIGSHQQLIATDGFYKKIYETDFF